MACVRVCPQLSLQVLPQVCFDSSEEAFRAVPRREKSNLINRWKVEAQHPTFTDTARHDGDTRVTKQMAKKVMR